MYAVVKTGAHQYRVKVGDEIITDKVQGNTGDKVTLDQVLMIGGEKLQIGAPVVAGAKVQATITEQFRDEKVLVFKYKRRQNYKRTRGHRQPLTKLTIDKIVH